MGALFASASSQFLTTTPPAANIPAYPFHVGLWVQPVITGAASTFWSLTNSGVVGSYLYLGTSTSNFTLGTGQGGSTSSATVANPVAGVWYFILGQCISATNRFLRVLDTTLDTVNSSQDTTSLTPSGLNTMDIGAWTNGAPAAQFANAIIAEWWMTTGSDWTNGVSLPQSLLRTLAFNGPFAIPAVRTRLKEYHSFRQGIISAQDEVGEVYQAWAGGPNVWTQSGNPTLSLHPPLPGYYAGPIDRPAFGNLLV